ncbi:hypothetical protein TRFO_41220 [Tritrichomonas foetus]|uniref:Uncharacterized protein n=1 Tax=Tritrichomonas foetus TaxID=1144522 RepID=A0A1J4L5H6_9EUKA|nr:hypothetical protein TRFO_41220 [Tritrichomonas foetus]|eukprot:OHT17190.1 hypothetical protein TRFO_41220 [Tritrichomonas foetus]
MISQIILTFLNITLISHKIILSYSKSIKLFLSKNSNQKISIMTSTNFFERLSARHHRGSIPSGKILLPYIFQDQHPPAAQTSRDNPVYSSQFESLNGSISPQTVHSTSRSPNQKQNTSRYHSSLDQYSFHHSQNSPQSLPSTFPSYNESCISPAMVNEAPSSFLFPSCHGRKLLRFAPSREEPKTRILPTYDVLPTREVLNSYRTTQKRLDERKARICMQKAKKEKCFMLDTFMPEELFDCS